MFRVHDPGLGVLDETRAHFSLKDRGVGARLTAPHYSLLRRAWCARVAAAAAATVSLVNLEEKEKGEKKKEEREEEKEERNAIYSYSGGSLRVYAKE